MLRKRFAFIFGFLEGFGSFMSVYLMYSLTGDLKIAGIISSIIGLPQFLVLFMYPLISGLICAFSALLFSSVYEFINIGKKSETGQSDSNSPPD